MYDFTYWHVFKYGEMLKCLEYTFLWKQILLTLKWRVLYTHYLLSCQIILEIILLYKLSLFNVLLYISFLK